VHAQDLWMFPNDVVTPDELAGFAVQALDGEVGTVDWATYEVGESYVAGYFVVDTGPWIFGKKVLIPAGLIDRIDPAEERIFVNRTRDDIKNAPEYTGSPFTEAAYRSELARYYGRGGAGRGERGHRAQTGRPAG
jgi:hypothetical protein